MSCCDGDFSGLCVKGVFCFLTVAMIDESNSMVSWYLCIYTYISSNKYLNHWIWPWCSSWLQVTPSILWGRAVQFDAWFPRKPKVCFPESKGNWPETRLHLIPHRWQHHPPAVSDDQSSNGSTGHQLGKNIQQPTKHRQQPKLYLTKHPGSLVVLAGES